jgi:hypothetical protein
MFSISNLLGGLLFFANVNYGDTTSLPKKIAAGLETWSANNPSEKVFLHTDKAVYLAGENIWYKAYVSLEGQPSILSKIVYVELVDEKGNVVSKQMRPITGGTSFGDMVIPKEIQTGNYSVNAYSLWMLNYPPFVFKKNLKIFKYDLNPTGEKKGTADFSNLQGWRSEADGLLIYYLFEVLWLENKSLMQLPLHERRTILKSIILPTKYKAEIKSLDITRKCLKVC